MLVRDGRAQGALGYEMIRPLATALLRLGGWHIEGGPPRDRAKYVLIAAPHTSNWDFIWLLACAGHFGMSIRWIGKHTLFRWPYAWLMRLLGGIPVRRDRRQSLVRQMADTLKEQESMILVVPVEGTRARVSHWRSGFYHIARTANVPIVMSYLDYGTKRAGIGPVLEPTGNVSRDMDLLRSFYADKVGKFPENTSPIRLVEENAPDQAPPDVAPLVATAETVTVASL